MADTAGGKVKAGANLEGVPQPCDASSNAQGGASTSGTSGRKRPYPSSSGAQEAGGSKDADNKQVQNAAGESAVVPTKASEADLAMAQWSTVRLECSSRTIRDEAALKTFLASLKQAPCLEALELALGERAHTRKAVRSVLTALAKAPANIKELALTFGATSREQMFALLRRVQGHLEKFTLNGQYQHAVYVSPIVTRRFWTALEETGVTTLELRSGDCLELQGSTTSIKLKPAKWRVENLSVGIALAMRKTLLPALIRANAASLRKVRLTCISMHPDDQKPVFAALAKCAGLVELSVPCFKEAAALHRCAALTKLTVSGSNLLLAGLFGGGQGGVDADVAPVARMLALPATVKRVESLTLELFKIDPNAALVLYKAVSAMKKLKSLTIRLCTGFALQLKDTLQSLPLLEELHLVDGEDPAWQAQVLADITPAVAPSLRSVRLDPDLLRGNQARLRDAARGIEQRFTAAARQLQVVVEEDPQPASKASDSSDEDDD